MGIAMKAFCGKEGPDQSDIINNLSIALGVNVDTSRNRTAEIFRRKTDLTIQTRLMKSYTEARKLHFYKKGEKIPED